MTRVLQKLEEETNKNETDIIELDFDKLPAVDEEEIEKSQEPPTIVSDDHITHDYHRRLMADHDRSPNHTVHHTESVVSMQNVPMTTSPHVTSNESTPISVSSIHLNPHKHPRLSSMNPHESVLEHAAFLHQNNLARSVHENLPVLGHGVHRLTNDPGNGH